MRFSFHAPYFYLRYLYGLRVPPEGGLRPDLFASSGHAIVLWYPTAPLARLLRDMDTLAQGLHGDAVMRVYSDHPESQWAIPELCAARGYELLPGLPLGQLEGDHRPFGRYYFDIQRPW